MTSEWVQRPHSAEGSTVAWRPPETEFDVVAQRPPKWMSYVGAWGSLWHMICCSWCPGCGNQKIPDCFSCSKEVTGSVREVTPLKATVNCGSCHLKTWACPRTSSGGLGSVRHWYLSFHFVFSRLVLRLCKYLILISRFVAVIHRVDHERILQMWPDFSAHCRAQMFSNQTFLCLVINIPCPRCPFFTPVTVHVSQLWANTSLYMKSTFVGCH